MTYLYIIIGIWTYLAIVWTCAILLPDSDRPDKASRLERFIKSKEELVEAYKQERSPDKLRNALEQIARGNVPGVTFAEDDLISEFAQEVLDHAR